jgi:hypothetical protein
MQINTFKEYLNLYLISLEQDIEKYIDDPIGRMPLNAAIHTTKHFIEVLNEH